MIRRRRETGTVEFVLDRDAAETPYLMGSWDGWQPPGIPMVRQPGEAPTWKTEVQLAPGEHQFRYRIGDALRWDCCVCRSVGPVPATFSGASADRSVPNGMGGRNSVVVVEETPKRGGRRSSPRMHRRNVW
jgi:hypothetical protein